MQLKKPSFFDTIFSNLSHYFLLLFLAHLAKQTEAQGISTATNFTDVTPAPSAKEGNGVPALVWIVGVPLAAATLLAGATLLYFRCRKKRLTYLEIIDKHKQDLRFDDYDEDLEELPLTNFARPQKV